MTTTSSALETAGLQKRFGSVRAVDGVDLRVEAGETRGLLGPNGAGKTTLLRMLFGLVRPDSGSIAIFGNSDPPEAVGRHGVAGFVEDPRFYPYLAGRRNLELLAELDGDDEQGRVGEVLELVGLTRQAGQRVGGYSTGMRQRLGIAAALLSRPRLLMLDEPTAGLDPGGGREVRALVRRLAEEGVTVVLSSHDMSEVNEVCDSVTIMSAGKVVWDGSMERLRAEAPPGAFRLVTSDDGRALLLATNPPSVRVQYSPPGGLTVTADSAAVDALVLALAAEGIAVRRLEEAISSVEAIFMSLTGDAAAGAEAMIQ